MSIAEVTRAIEARVQSSSAASSLPPPLVTGLSVLDETSNPVRRGSVVDISGASHAGKTQLLHLIIASVLDTARGVHGAKVVWFDLNGGLLPHRLSAMMNEEVDLNEVIRWYPVENTLKLCAGLRELEGFVGKGQGKNVATVVIDALGTFHHEDKYRAKETATFNDEVAFCNIVRGLAERTGLVFYVTKTPLFPEERLKTKWPFQNAGVPTIPREFMPDVWTTVTSHRILVYGTATERQGERALVVMAKQKGEMQVIAAGVVMIEQKAVTEVEGSLYLVRD